MTRDDIDIRVKQVLIDMFELDKASVTNTASLYEDLDLDSLDAIDLAVKLKTETGIKLKEQEMKAIRSVQDIIDVVCSNLEKTNSLAN